MRGDYPPFFAPVQHVLRVEFTSEARIRLDRVVGGRGLSQAKGVPPTRKNERYPYLPTDFLNTLDPPPPSCA